MPRGPCCPVMDGGGGGSGSGNAVGIDEGRSRCSRLY